MNKIIMLKGIAGSGKTKWSKERVKKGGYIRVSMDDLRESVYGGWSVKKEQACLNMRDDMVRAGIKQGKNVIVDATNLNPKHERRLKALAEELNCGFEINDSFLKKSPEECIEADLHRGSEAVGSSVIWEMYYKWVAPEPLTKLEKNFDKPRAVICDLEGCLCLNKSGRGYRDYTRVGEDIVDPFVSCIIDSLGKYGLEISNEKYPTILLVSGRPEDCRKETEDWLERNDISYDKLFMRRSGDLRKDVEVKEEIYLSEIAPHFAVLGVIEDRPRCARMYRKLGLRTLQAGYPEIEF